MVQYHCDRRRILKENSWMCILHQYHNASILKVCTAMCQSERKNDVYIFNSKWWHPRFSPGKGWGVFGRERI